MIKHQNPSTKSQINSNVLNSKSPHLIPLPSGERGRVRGSFEIGI
jgi:hypothetical protein